MKFFKNIFLINKILSRGTVNTVFDSEEKKPEGLEHVQGILDKNQFDELSKLEENERMVRLEGIKNFTKILFVLTSPEMGWTNAHPDFQNSC